ncbi:MAG: sigma-70 family RNA polymerase sigma factor [Planctomycetota bacterium]
MVQPSPSPPDPVTATGGERPAGAADTTPATPEPLMPRIAAGDRAAVSQCLARYRGLVWSLARRSLADVGEAEDLVQEVFIELWRKADRFDPARGKETTFVAVLTRRRVIDRLRRKRTRPEPVEVATDQPGSSAGPDALAEIGDELGRVRAALAELRPDQADALRLAVCDGLTHAETAERLNLPLGTVKTHVRRGLQKLRDRLDAKGGES